MTLLFLTKSFFLQNNILLIIKGVPEQLSGYRKSNLMCSTKMILTK